MSLTFKGLLKSVYKKIPPDAKPRARQAYGYLDLRSKAIAGRLPVCQGHRVEFLDVEIAYLEHYEFLGPARGQALVDTHCTLISPGTERAVLCSLPGIARGMFPFPPGYSAVGTVRRAGRGLPGVKVGQRVAGRVPHASAGIMSHDSLFPVPDNVTDEQAAFIELGIITLQGVRRAGIVPGDRVAVVGQGLIGQLANRLARVCGAVRVTGVAASRNRAGNALESGSVDEFVALADRPPLGDIGADIVIEAVGTPSAVVTAMNCARNGGTVILLGSSRGLGRNIDIFNNAQKRQLTIVGAHIGAVPDRDVSRGRYTYQREGELFLELLGSGRLEVTDLITWRASPADCNAVYEVVARGGDHHVGIMFDWNTWKAEHARSAGAAS
jgi:2-desacetyl-2-hydroxyethyl bacteriochlorophyllide A dehydrogenase